MHASFYGINIFMCLSSTEWESKWVFFLRKRKSTHAFNFSFRKHAPRIAIVLANDTNEITVSHYSIAVPLASSTTPFVFQISNIFIDSTDKNSTVTVKIIKHLILILKNKLFEICSIFHQFQPYLFSIAQNFEKKHTSFSSSSFESFNRPLIFFFT